MLLGSLAKMAVSDSARSEHGRPARDGLARKWDELEFRLRDRMEIGAEPVKAAPPGDEAKRAGVVPGKQEHGECTRSSTVPAHGAERPSPEAPLQQFDAAHARLLDELRAGFAAAAAKKSDLSAVVSSAADKVGRGGGQDQNAREDLEQETEVPSQRLDPAARRFAPLGETEKSVRELSAQLADMRRSGAGGFAPDDETRTGAKQQAILDAIGSLRALHEATANRAALAWTSIQASLEQVAGICGRLEAAAAGELANRPTAGVDPNDPFLPLLARLAPRGAVPQPNKIASASTRVSAPASIPVAVGNIHNMGSVTEFGPPGANGVGEPQGQTAPLLANVQQPERSQRRTDFLAAARRAARTAQLEEQGRASAAQEEETADGKSVALLLRRGMRLFAAYRRPIVVGAAAMFVLVVAVTFGRLPILGDASDFLPPFLRQFHASQTRSAEMALGTNSANRTAVIQAVPRGSTAAPPATEVSGEIGAPNTTSATSNAPVAAAAPDLLTPPEAFRSPDRQGSTTKPGPRAISGSDPIVSAAMQARTTAPIPRPGRVPVHAPTALSPASKAQPVLPSFGSGATIARVAPDGPSPGVDNELLTRAQTGDPEAQFELAARYAEDPATKGKLALAAQWYEKAASQGHAVAEYRLASLYEKGGGVAKDIERAKDLYQRAAEKGNIRAMHNLGVLAAEGSDGKPNYTSAALWFGKAAEYGIKDSQYNFAVLLARGLGVTKDLARSYTWFAIVAATGDVDAAQKRDEVAARLTSSELAAANSAAAAFVPDAPDRAANEPAPSTPGQEAAKANAGSVKSQVSGL